MGGPKTVVASEVHFDERTTARLRALGYLAPAPDGAAPKTPVTVPASATAPSAPLAGPPPANGPPARAQ